MHEGMKLEHITELVQQVRKTHAKMGGKKLYHLLQPDLSRMSGRFGRDKFFALLKQKQLLVKRRRKYAVTTQSSHWFRVYDNKLKTLKPARPDQGWVCDITYVRIRKGFVYLFLLTDVYSRKIVGWEVSNSLSVEGAIKAVGKAVRQCKNPKDLIHHSDRGFQYCSHEYVKILKKAGIQISMGEAGNCYDNAMAERVNGILKQEYSLDNTFANEQQVRQAARQGINAYNESRPHWALKLDTPSNVHRKKQQVKCDN